MFILEYYYISSKFWNISLCVCLSILAYFSINLTDLFQHYGVNII